MSGDSFKLRLLLPACFAVLLLGCVATAAQWMAYVAVDPDNLNQVLLDATGNVVHVSEQSDGLHIATYDADGMVVQETTLVLALTGTERALGLPGGQLLLVGDTLAGAMIVDANLHQITPLPGSMLPLEAQTRLLVDVVPVLGQKLAAFGAVNDEGWVLLMDFSTGAGELLTLPSATSVTGAYGYTALMLEVESAAGREVVAFDELLNEVSRFSLPANEDLIGVSLNRPALFNRSNQNVRVTDLAGNTQWEFENTEYEFIDGQSVGPDGSILLWGDNASLNLLGVKLDSAHFLMISADGLLQYHHLGGKDMVNIRYTHRKQFANGLLQVSYQGLTGQVSGLVVGSVGPDGSILLWGDNASLNLLGVKLDSAHFLMISADGLLQYHHLGGKDMVNIRYTHRKQFANGLLQVSYQGLTGQVSGLVVGSSSLGVPFTVTRQVFHDFVTPMGTKTRFMKEPKRVETYTQQCDFLCLPILMSQSEGHCDNLDVFNVSTDSLISVSQVCGATGDTGLLLPNTVKVSLY